MRALFQEPCEITSRIVRISLIHRDFQPAPFVSVHASIDEIACLLASSAPGVVVVTRSGRPVGTITGRDILNRAEALGGDLCGFKAVHLMNHPALLIGWHSDESDLIDAAILLKRQHLSHAVVVRDGAPCGVISFSALQAYNPIAQPNGELVL